DHPRNRQDRLHAGAGRMHPPQSLPGAGIRIRPDSPDITIPLLHDPRIARHRPVRDIRKPVAQRRQPRLIDLLTHRDLHGTHPFANLAGNDGTILSPLATAGKIPDTLFSTSPILPTNNAISET